MPKRNINLSLKKEENTFTCKEQLCQVDTPRKWNSSKKRNVVIDAAIQLSGIESNDKTHQRTRIQREQIGTLPRFSKLPNAAIFGIEEVNTRDGMAIMDTRSHVPLWRGINQSCFNQWKRKRRMHEPTSKCILGLHTHQKSTHTGRNSETCGILLANLPDTEREHWPLVSDTQINPRNDEQTRAGKIKFRHGTLSCAEMKLRSLELEN